MAEWTWVEDWRPADGKPRPWEYVFQDDAGMTYNQWGEKLDSVGNVAMGGWGHTQAAPAPRRQQLSFPTVSPTYMMAELWQQTPRTQVLMPYPEGWR